MEFVEARLASLPQKICEFCGKSSWDTKTLSCIKCKTIYSKSDFQNLSNLYTAASSEHYVDIRYRNWFERVEAYEGILLDLIDRHAVTTAVDIGCGPNRLLEHCKNKREHLSIRGYDLYTREENICQHNFEKHPIPYDDFPASLSVCSHVLEHIENLHDIIEQMLNNSECVFVAIPNPLFYKTLMKSSVGMELGGLEGLPYSRPMDRHRWMYTVKEANGLMEHMAGKHSRSLEIYYAAPNLYALLARVNRNLFVNEMIYVFSRH